MVIFLSGLNNGDNKGLDWTPSLSLNDKRPLGLYILNKELKSLFASKEIIKRKGSLLQYFDEKFEGHNGTMASTFFYIGRNTELLGLEQKEINYILHSGFNGFIVTNELPDEVLAKYGISFRKEHFSELKKLTIGNHEMAGVRWMSPRQFTWIKINTDQKVNVRILGKVIGVEGKEYPNFIRIEVGEGSLYLLSTPELFTNYYLLKENTQKYTEEVFSMLPGKRVAWFTGEFSTASKGPLAVIMTHEALRKAFYLTLIGILLFILINSKRKQRIIPIKIPNSNKTVEFVQTIGNLYYRYISFSDILRMRLNYLKEKLWSEMLVSMESPDDEIVGRLSAKTGKPEIVIQEWLSMVREIETGCENSKEFLLKFDSYIYNIFIDKKSEDGRKTV